MAMPGPTRRVTRKLHLVDTDTGQVTEGDATWEEPSKRTRKGRRMTFTMIETSPDGIGRLHLTGFEFRVLLQFIAHMDTDSSDVRTRISDLAADLDAKAPNVSRAVATLRDRRIVFRESASRWRVNKHIAYRGSADDWGQKYYTDPEPIWEVSP